MVLKMWHIGCLIIIYRLLPGSYGCIIPCTNAIDKLDLQLDVYNNSYTVWLYDRIFSPESHAFSVISGLYSKFARYSTLPIRSSTPVDFTPVSLTLASTYLCTRPDYKIQVVPFLIFLRNQRRLLQSMTILKQAVEDSIVYKFGLIRNISKRENFSIRLFVTQRDFGE